MSERASAGAYFAYAIFYFTTAAHVALRACVRARAPRFYLPEEIIMQPHRLPAILRARVPYRRTASRRASPINFGSLRFARLSRGTTRATLIRGMEDAISLHASEANCARLDATTYRSVRCDFDDRIEKVTRADQRKNYVIRSDVLLISESMGKLANVPDRWALNLLHFSIRFNNNTFFMVHEGEVCKFVHCRV